MGALHYSASSVFGRSAWRPVCVCVYSEGGGGGGDWRFLNCGMVGGTEGADV